VESGKQLAWRSAVVPVPAKGRARVSPKAAPAATDSRERAVMAMVDWCRRGDRPLWLVEGGAGVGKTQLASDVAARLVAEKWTVGWARPGLAGAAVHAAARSGRHSLVLVDDAETRADMVELLPMLTGAARPLSVRVIVLARQFGGWWQELLSRLSPMEQQVLTSGRTVMSEAGVTGPRPGEVALRPLQAGENDPRSRAVTTLTTADPVSGAVLLRLAALVVALPTRVGQLGPTGLRAAMRDLFEEEEGYWRRTATEVSPPGEPAPALRSALTCAAIVGADGLTDAATVLRRVPALAAGAADRLARLAVWWHGLFLNVTGDGGISGPRLPAWLSDRLPNGVESTGVSWTVAALDAERRATSSLARMARDAHREVWPTNPSRAAADPDLARQSLHRAVRAAAPVDEALAWLIRELELDPADLETLASAISHPARNLGRTAVVLAQRLLDTAQTPTETAGLALELGARLSEVGRWSDARDLTERAVKEFRQLAEEDRERWLPELAVAVSNLGSVLAQLGARDEALTATYEAVALHRELLPTDRDRYLPSLARALTNLSACLSRAGRRPAALGAAGQAVAIYRELVELHPNAYRAELAAADHNWRICRQAVGQPVAGRAPA
jgi:tetratricopeptide (TPR) repeat protein